MKYSLRSLMIGVTLFCVACFLIPEPRWTPWGAIWFSWSDEQCTVFFVVGVAIAFVGVLALARSSSYGKP